jgi:hypothetical protein
LFISVSIALPAIWYHLITNIYNTRIASLSIVCLCVYVD